jgi:superkiller protein 3
VDAAVSSARGLIALARGDAETAVAHQEQACDYVTGAFLYQRRMGIAMLKLATQRSDPQLQRLALTALLRAAKLNASDGAVFAAIGQCYLASDRDRAQRCFEKALALDPLQAEAAHLLLELYKEKEDTASAKALLQRMASAPGTQRIGWLWLSLGSLQLHSGEANAAVRSLQNALRAQSDDARVWLALGKAYRQRGSYLSSLKALTRCCEMSPGNLEALTTRADVYHALGLDSQAVAGFEEALAVEPRHPPAAMGLATTHYDAARHLLADGRRGPAALELSKALPALAALLAGIGRVTSALKLAGDLCTLVLSLPAPLRPESSAFTQVATTLGAPEASAAACAASAYAHLVRQTGSAQAWVDLALARWRAARLARVETSTRDDAAVATMLREALAAAQAAIAIEPQSGSAWSMVGAAAAELDAPVLAAHAFTRAAELNGNSAQAAANLGAIYLQQGEVQQAYSAFYRAQALDPGLPQGWIGQAMVAEQLCHTETLDLFRHASELATHPLACLGFAGHVVAATTPEGAEQAASLMVGRPWGPRFKCEVPRGYGQLYTQRAMVAIASYTASPEGREDARGHYLAAQLLERLGAVEAAADRYRQCLSLVAAQASGGKPNGEGAREATFGLGRALSRAKRHQEAIQVLADAQPTTMSEYVILARALADANQLTPAFQVCA